MITLNDIVSQIAKVLSAPIVMSCGAAPIT